MSARGDLYRDALAQQTALQAEIDRLRAENEKWSKQAIDAGAENARLRDEVKRLTVPTDHAPYYQERSDLGPVKPCPSCEELCYVENNWCVFALGDDNARLRELLREAWNYPIRQHGNDDLKNRCIAALSPATGREESTNKTGGAVLVTDHRNVDELVVPPPSQACPECGRCRECGGLNGQHVSRSCHGTGRKETT